MADEAHQRGAVLLCHRSEEVRGRPMSGANWEKCNAIKFWPLKKGVPSDEEIARLADNIKQDWKRLGAALGVKEKYLNEIEINNPNDVYERALNVLQKWKKKHGRKATYDKLAEALHDQLVQRPGLMKAFSTDGEDNNVWILKTGNPTEEELHKLAQEIPQDWKRIGRAVGLKEKHLKIIEIDNDHDVCERAFATLYKWKQKQGREATYAKLAEALDDDLVQRRDLVEAFCCHVHSQPVDVKSSQDSMDLLVDQPQQVENEGALSEEYEQGRLSEKDGPKITDTKQHPSSNVTESGSSTFQETLRTWKKRESVRERKERTPSLRVRQAKMTSTSQGEPPLRQEIEQIFKDTMETAMEKVDVVLKRVQSCSTTAKKSPAVVVRQEPVTDEEDSHKEDDSLGCGINSETALENEEKTKTKGEPERDTHQANMEIETDVDEADADSEQTTSTTGLFEEFSNSFFFQFSNISQWLFN